MIMEFFDIQIVGQALIEVLHVNVIGWIVVGVLLGIIFGATPGLTATTAVALFTPITFGLSFNNSFAFLLGIYCGGYYAGSIPAILIKTPGAPGNAATTIDGYPMAQQGMAGEALMHSVFSSWIGGVFSALSLFLLAPLFSSLALKFGPQEYFAVAVLGFSCIASISGKSILKGLVAGMIGVLLGTVGMDPMDGIARFTFGSMDLMSGIELIPGLIGFFAISEVFSKTELLDKEKGNVLIKNVKRVLPDIGFYLTKKLLVFKSALIGTIVGAVPGTGPAIASWISYNEAKRSSKHPEEFGNGAVEGIISCETANNAVTGGAIIPLLTLGIPGDAVTAILLSALMIQGLTPGPMMIVEKFDIVSLILWMLIIANCFMLLFGILGGKYFSKILSVPPSVLLPLILVLSVAGCYAIGNSVFDVKLAMVLGIFGFIMLKFGLPIAPAVLGLVLGPIIEPNLRLAMIGSFMDPLIFVKSPLSAIFLMLTVVLTYSLYRRNNPRKKKETASNG